MSIYLVVMLVAFFILIFGMNNTLKNYFINKGYESLTEQSQSVQDVFLNGDMFFVINTKQMIEEIADLERHFNTKLWIIDGDGVVYINSRDEDVPIVKSELKVDEVNQVFSGQIIRRQGYFSTVSNDPVITVGYPIKNKKGEVIFALYSHGSLPEILETTKGVYLISMIALGVSIILASIMIFLFSRTLIGDIKKLNKAVNIISTGDYDYKLVEDRKDEIGQLATNLNKMSTDMKALEIQRQNFISDVSHDFRSPLTNIIGFSEGIIDGSIEEKNQRKYLEIIRDESHRLMELSNDIIDLSNVQSVGDEIEKKVVNIESLILNILDSYEQKIIEKNINVDIVFSSTHENVVCNRKQIDRVLNNLVDNAIKFINEGGDLKIRTKEIQGKLEMRISNTGSYIAPSTLDQIWLRFSKGDASRGAERKSFGLGLAIVKEIIENHREEITIVNHKSEGVTFIFSLISTQEREM